LSIVPAVRIQLWTGRAETELRVNVSASAWHRIKADCQGQSLGLIPVKGKGEMEIFRVEALR